MIATRGAGVTAAAGTGLTHHLFVKIFTLDKSSLESKHLGSPYHTFVHCKGFLPAAPLRARTLISVSFSGLPLSRPVLIFALVSLYLTNKLISRQLILWRRNFGRKSIPALIFYKVLSSVSRGYSLP